MRNLIEATPKSVKRFVLTTSAGVDRSNKIPFSILNLFGKENPATPITACYVMARLCQSFLQPVSSMQECPHARCKHLCVQGS